ncbi:hypothetical protein GE09DRAFT_1056381 [Coniochaeta sp. 2T2.1]|nr:hypothetical protein GE09DRAFT_1056381 [Coniochaeta sp. 2T2.1]
MAPRASARLLPNDPQRHHADFIQRFTQQESERRIAKKPKALTAAQHAALREQLKEVYFLKPDYADNTKINIAGMLRKWKGREVLKWYDATLVPRFDLQAPNSGGKDVADSGDLLALLTFNIAYDTSIFSWERHRVELPGCYLGLAFTGARPAEFVDGEKKHPKDGCLEELFGRKAIEGSLGGKDEDGALDDESKVLEEILSQETVGRGRPKCLCYEDILLMVVCYPDTGEDTLAMSIKFIHHKGADNKPKPPIEPKAWRRGAANAANGNAPDAVRDQMMRYDPKWATFNSAYINEKV